MEPIQALSNQLEKIIFVGLDHSDQINALAPLSSFFKENACEIPMFQRVVSAMEVLMDTTGSDQVRATALTELTVLTHALLVAQASFDQTIEPLQSLGPGIVTATPLRASAFTQIAGLSNGDTSWKKWFPHFLNLYGQLDFRLVGPAIPLLLDHEIAPLASDYLMANADNPAPFIKQQFEQGFLTEDVLPWIEILDQYFGEEGEMRERSHKKLMSALQKGDQPWLVKSILEDHSDDMTDLLVEEGKKILFQVTTLSVYDPQKTEAEPNLPHQEWEQRRRLGRVLYCLQDRQEEKVIDFLVECLKWVRYLAGVRFTLDVTGKNKLVDSAQQVAFLLQGVEDQRVKQLLEKPWMPKWITEEMKQ